MVSDVCFGVDGCRLFCVVLCCVLVCCTCRHLLRFWGSILVGCWFHVVVCCLLFLVGSSWFVSCWFVCIAFFLAVVYRGSCLLDVACRS